MSRTIQLNAQQYKALHFTEARVTQCIHTLDNLQEYPVAEGELSIAFLDDKKIAEIHQTFLQDSSPTDVITFPGDSEMEFAGEICVSIDHALSASKEHRIPFAEELTLYIVHGYLHLAGFNDYEEKDILKMRAAETNAMQNLRELEAIPDFALKPHFKSP